MSPCTPPQEQKRLDSDQCIKYKDFMKEQERCINSHLNNSKWKFAVIPSNIGMCLFLRIYTNVRVYSFVNETSKILKQIES